jgi:HK97 family phage prohead protease
MAKPKTIHKSYVTHEVVPLSDTERTARFRISTDVIDRQKDVVDPAGWHVDDFMKNPVVLFGHDYHSLPVARALSVTGDEHGLSMVAQFPAKDVYPFADTVYQLVKAGYLNATSVGFSPVKWERDPEIGGTRYHEQTLLEVSIVPVPANPQALIEARSAGIDTAPLIAWAEAVLKSAANPDAEAVLKSATQGALPLVTEPVDDDEIPDPVKAVADVAPVVEKKGRVLSAKNEAAIMAACDAMESATKALRDVLMSAIGAPAAEPDDEDKKTDTAAITKATDADGADVLRLTIADEPVYDFKLLDDPEPTFTLNPEDLAAVLGASIKAAVVRTVDDRVTLTLNALRGRLD